MQIRNFFKVAALAVSLSLTFSTLAGELEGTSWRLLNIASMDDSNAMPADSNQYTLAFGADGKMSIKADCNRGAGTWTSESEGHLKFGPIAATRALCPPESLSETFLAQFEWVRSFTMRDGHLFLATLADGSIIEFEPLPPAVATLFGEPVHAASAGELQQVLSSALLDHYAAEEGIAVADDELETYLDNMRRGMAAEGLTAGDDLTDEEREQVATMQSRMGSAMIRQWKINKSLYDAYGGRIIYQQLGPEPLDAYRTYFEERQDAGDFTIDDAQMAKSFWSYFTDESRHDFMAPGGEDAAQAFAEPPWKEN